MPIIGLTDRGLEFAIIGKIKKGTREERTTQAGKKYMKPIDLDYFRVIIDERETDAIEAFRLQYGDQPRELNIFFPFNRPDKFWDAWLKAFTASRQWAVSDGEYMQYMLDPQTAEPCIVNGKDVVTGERVPHIEKPKGLNGVDLEWKASGKLNVIIPELERAAYLTFYTSSVYDILHISAQLKAITEFTNGQLAGIPFLLKRRPQTISVPKGKNTTDKIKVEKWLVDLELHPAYVKAKMIEYKRIAMPDVPYQLVANVDVEGEGFDEDEITPDDFKALPEPQPPENFVPEYIDGEFDESTQVDPETGEVITLSEEAPANVEKFDAKLEDIPEPPDQNAVLTPEQIKTAVVKLAHPDDGEYKALVMKPLTELQQKKLRTALELCFVGDEDASNKAANVLEYLTGVRVYTSKALDKAIYAAIADRWLKLKQKTKNDPYHLENPNAAVEADLISRKLIESLGVQQVLL